jgi:hypothetical protein
MSLDLPLLHPDLCLAASNIAISVHHIDLQVKIDEKKSKEPILPTVTTSNGIEYSSIIPSSSGVEFSAIALGTPHGNNLTSERPRSAQRTREEDKKDPFGFSRVSLESLHNDLMLSQRIPTTGPTGGDEYESKSGTKKHYSI